MKRIISSKWKETLSEKFQAAEKLRTENEYCDVTLQSVDKINVKAHKIILVTGSNYFKDLFSSGFKESTSNSIEYKNIKGEILEKVISFVYTGELEVITLEKLEEVAICANYFQLHDLNDECVKILSESINDDNCLKYWRLAHECFQENFEKLCITHMLSSPNLLYKNDTFFDQLDMDEVKTLLKDVRLKWSEDVKFEKILKWCKLNTNSKESFGDTFSKLLDIIDFSLINKDVILCYVLKDDDLAEHKNIRNRIAESLDRTKELETETKTLSNLIKSNKKLFVVIGNELKTISNDGIFSTVQRKEESFTDIEHTLFKDYLFICGGRNKNGNKISVTNFCEYFDSNKKKWKDFPEMKIPRFWHGCTFLQDKIYVCGGRLNGNFLSSVEIFDFGKEKWIEGREMNVGRDLFGIVSINGSVYIVSGREPKNIEMFDPRTQNGWTEIHEGFEQGGYTQCVSINNDIYCFRRDKEPYIFDIRKNDLRTWEGEINYIKPTADFRVCLENGYFNFIQYNSDEEKYVDFYKYDLKGNLVYSQPKILHLDSKMCFGAFSALNYQ